MPAITTTPVNVGVDSYYTTTATNQPTIASVTSRRAVAPVVAPVNVSGITHLSSIRLPIRRWNGTTWLTEYVPRF